MAGVGHALGFLSNWSATSTYIFVAPLTDVHTRAALVITALRGLGSTHISVNAFEATSGPSAIDASFTRKFKNSNLLELM